ncbi:MAG: glycosyltransferase [Acidobacteriaceae bacterium]
MEAFQVEGHPGERPTVAHFLPWPSIGGVEIATLRMAAATSQKFRNVAFCLAEACELRDAFEKAGIETVTYTPPEPSLRHAGKFYKESKLVARDLKRIGADVVHFADIKAAYHNSLAALLLRLPTVCHVRSQFSSLDARWRLCLFPVQQFIFVSDGARQSFAWSMPDSKARVIYDAMEVSDVGSIEQNHSVREEFNIPVGCHLIGMVARVNPQKDYYTLAEAAAEVLQRHPDTRFLIVGDNSIVERNRQHYAEVAQKLSELGIAEKFIFAGYREDVSRLISAMDIVVLSTHREGLPLCILEAMSLGKPVVATAVDGIPEMITHGVTGYLYPHGNSKELAVSIMDLIENPDQARRLGLAGYAHVQKSFSPEVFLNNISEAYLDRMHKS